MPERLPAPDTVYIGLGANLDDPRAHVEQAAAELAELPASRLEALSWLYRTTPVGPVDQPDYINAAVRLRTRLGPLALLDALQRIERRHGRVRDGTRWGPRTLDLDILLFGTRRVAQPRLRLPHPEIRRRAFVLVPLAEVAPGALSIPGQGRLDALLAGVSRVGVAPLAPMALPLPASGVPAEPGSVASPGAAEPNGPVARVAMS